MGNGSAKDEITSTAYFCSYLTTTDTAAYDIKRNGCSFCGQLTNDRNHSSQIHCKSRNIGERMKNAVPESECKIVHVPDFS